MPVLFRRLVGVAGAIAAAAAMSAVCSAQTMGSPERYTAAAINMNRSAEGSIEIVVNRWSSDKDRDRLMSVLMDKGADKLLDVLQDMPRMGYFRAPGNLGWDIHFA